jgi:hypothetical protein
MKNSLVKFKSQLPQKQQKSITVFDVNGKVIPKKEKNIMKYFLLGFVALTTIVLLGVTLNFFLNKSSDAPENSVVDNSQQTEVPRFDQTDNPTVKSPELYDLAEQNGDDKSKLCLVIKKWKQNSPNGEVCFITLKNEITGETTDKEINRTTWGILDENISYFLLK